MALARSVQQGDLERLSRRLHSRRGVADAGEGVDAGDDAGSVGLHCAFAVVGCAWATERNLCEAVASIRRKADMDGSAPPHAEAWIHFLDLRGEPQTPRLFRPVAHGFADRKSTRLNS